jgi:hypothetical protein
MAYRLRLSPDAAERLASLAKPLRNHVVTHLHALSANPAQVSMPGHFPYPPNLQVYHIVPFVEGEDRHDFTVLFRYAQDETCLEIIGIGHTIGR